MIHRSGWRHNSSRRTSCIAINVEMPNPRAVQSARTPTAEVRIAIPMNIKLVRMVAIGICLGENLMTIVFQVQLCLSFSSTERIYILMISSFNLWLCPLSTLMPSKTHSAEYRRSSVISHLLLNNGTGILGPKLDNAVFSLFTSRK
ncbi:hypothetical protein B0H13DRAFT_767677 [Mycena leptocephala]|nr:hypothetical protein B0H13DRAFT_767677 [Mycena leptocephala]